MSVADLKRYGQKIQENPEVCERAKAIGVANLDGQIAYGKELGLTFNKDDLQTLADEAGITKGELSEELLEQIAGGCVSLTALAVGMAAGVLLGAAAAGVGGCAASKTW
jgi:predicted ribosomally synthesized peptide with nif11-like leader